MKNGILNELITVMKERVPKGQNLASNLADILCICLLYTSSNFILQALNNEDITIYGDGKQTRSFQYIDDLIEGMIRMMNTEDGFTRCV